MPRFVVSMILLGAMMLGAGLVSGQNYPNKPIRIWTSTAGGGSDFFARLIAQGITGPLGQPVVIENRTSLQASETVAKSPPDGYNLVYGGSGLMYTPLMVKTSYDAIKDFAPITLTAIAPNVVVVHPSLPVKSVKDLIALAKARPGELNFSTGVPGASSHLAGELFKSMTGVNMIAIHFKGAGPALLSLLGGEVQLMFADLSNAMVHVKSGKLRTLAVTSLEPTALVPGAPTLAASGLPGYDIVAIDAMWAPAGTPAPIINRLNQEVVRVLGTPDTKEKYFAQGADVAASTPDQLMARMKADIAITAKLIKDAGIKTQQ